ncbi:cyanophycin synthetase [Deinococcus altitudinis]|uniref:cyanophycin synthetase n=1 Tax=Deinococcus altitudinis TaxID=468914 RepID=UPI003892680C
MQSSAQFMRVLDRGVYRGPHLYSAFPMVRLTLDLGALEEWPSNLLPDFNARLLALLPGLREHGCSLQRPGGFVERLEAGTWLGHVTEHVALELQTQVGHRVTRGKTRSVRSQPGVYQVLYTYQDEQVALLAGRTALQLVDSLLPPELRGVRGLDRICAAPPDSAPQQTFELPAMLAALEGLARSRTLGPTTRALVEEARRRRIPVRRLDEQSLVLLGTGSRQKRLRASITGDTSHLAVIFAGNKAMTKTLLAKAGVPVPGGAVVSDVGAAVHEAGRLGFPVVVKPLDGNHGRGVSVDLQDAAAVGTAFERAAQHSARVVVEQFYPGHDHRILVVGGQVVAVSQRVPAHVTGDGMRTVQALIDEVNRDPRRGVGHEQVMTRITATTPALSLLSKRGYTLASVPAAGEQVMLSETANLSTGGTAIDRTDVIHPDNAFFARRAAATIGLDIAGIDFMAPDISRSVRETGGGIVEVNAAPGFRMHQNPSEGQPRDVAGPVLSVLFPPGTPSQIPILAITGTNGKTTTARMIAHVLARQGLTVGLTSTSGVYVDGHLVASGDATGPRSAGLVLDDPLVDVAVLETARGGLLREGLGFQQCDVGVVLNVQADHLGLKGIETLDDLARVKSVIVNVVRRGGTSVLNADDPLTRRMARRSGGRPAFFSLHGDDLPPALQLHVSEGGLAAVQETIEHEAWIVLHQGAQRTPVIRTADIPATLLGQAAFNVQNALAATLACAAHGVSPADIAGALRTFTSSFEQAPGRLNIYDGHSFRVILDYAHNAAGLRALGDLLQKLRAQHPRVLGMVSIPGDRRDEDIFELGQVAAGIFDELIFREAPDGRGRPTGDVLQKLTEGALTAGFSPDRIHRVLEEQAAVESILRMATPGDLVVLLPTAIASVWGQVVNFSNTVD